MTRPPARIRLRRRLLLFSAVPAVLVTLLAVKLISVVVVGGAAQQHYASGDIGALSDDVSLLQVANMIEPANATVAAGVLAVLQDRLDVADMQFTAALETTDDSRSCPVRINLELVRERRGDIDAWEARLDDARQRYEEALTVIAEAPPACFSGNDDPDPQRRAVRADAAARVQAKIDALGTVAPLAPPSPPPPAAPVAPTAPPPAGADQPRPDERRLDIGEDPLAALRQLLRDAAG
ncbi:hypothetical protein [Mycolicibacterium gilvum]|uniref:Uncharacterized protein n=1 Tax=Mycolicibacterium gilvum TaxID=1804 RepID=A0A378SIF2_9MYCO|nr:hypothetical protein [Mycolicibacterium gilvum]MCV7056212.1 hypothetical protein [Mycolicibacterium gilvum]STZ41634.1 Uncharacterised protein [Mycolicibacterium gilvum]